jgi:hypothetical protein
MKRGFIRGVWGIYDNSHRLLARRSRIDGDMDNILKNPFGEPFVTYVMGGENFKKAKDKGFNCILINKEPYMFDLIKYQYRHKIEIIRYAMEEDSYDEVVWLDWDCVPQKKLRPDFWEECNKKDSFQACLQIYHKKKCHWRATDLRKVPNGGFLYIRDKNIPSEAIKIWETIPQDNDEPAWAKMTDTMTNGWKGMDEYWKHFETPFCNLHRGSPFPNDLLKSKDIYFMHFQG